MKLDTDYTCEICGETITDDDDLHTDPHTGGDVCKACCPVCSGEISDNDICPGCGLLVDKPDTLCKTCLPI